MTDTPSLYQLYQSLLNDITQNSKQFPILSSVSSKINRKPGEILLIVLILITILTSLGFLGHYFTIFLGCVLALQRTLLAEQSGNINQKHEWLTFWFVIGILISLQFVLGDILLIVPFYDFAKLLLVISMVFPKSSLADRIHHYFIRPNILQNQQYFKQQ